MTADLTTRSQSTNKPAIFKLMEGDPFFAQVQEVYDALARRAYELFDGRGRQDGDDLQDWFQAESELLCSTPVEVDDTNEELIVRADVPGFHEKDIEVRVQPRRLIIRGKREQGRDPAKQKLVYSERGSGQVLRTLDLWEEIDPDHVKATLQDGTLEITLPKARPAKKVPLIAKAA
jgi:HSP20 family protein